MASHEEERALKRAETLARARHMAKEWGYWCAYTDWGSPTGRKPRIATGGLERRYRAPPMWHPPEPRLPEPNERVGVPVQQAFATLPRIYRLPLIAEFCLRPWVIPLRDGELEPWLARRARVSVGAYHVTLERALFALVNVLKQRGAWGA